MLISNPKKKIQINAFKKIKKGFWGITFYTCTFSRIFLWVLNQHKNLICLIL